MQVHQSIFRKYDIRGIAGQEITEDLAYHLGRAYGSVLKEGGGSRIAVGQDVRPHSTPLKDALIDGLRDTGVSVLDLGTVPTPLMYFALFQLDVHGGIQVTASHNPPEYNGFKINLGKDTVYGDGIQDLRKRIETENYLKTHERGTRQTVDIVSPYIDWTREHIHIEPRFRLAIDTGNGTAGPLMKDLLDAYGIEFIGLYLEPDGTFPNHLADPTVVQYMQDLIQTVQRENLDLGIGLDGDADRIGVVDDTGTLLFGDRILGIFAGEILERYPGATIVFDVKCSQGLVEYIQKKGGQPLMWKTGHSLLKAKLKEVQAPLAGEMSGHIFFQDRYFGYDDAIHASMRLLEILSKTDRKLSDLVAEIPAYHSTPEIRVGCPDDRKFDVVAQIVQRFKDEGYHVIDIDGARVQFDDGFGLVRASNTQPVLVVRCEGKTPERLQEICELIKSKLSAFPEVDLSGFEIPGH